MTTKTCAACDSPLDGNAITVKLGRNAVEVCCDECAQALREADASKLVQKEEAAVTGRS